MDQKRLELDQEKAQTTAVLEAQRIASQNEQAQAKNDLAEAKAIIDAGALSVRAYITHGVLSGEACQKVEKSVLDELVVTDSIPNRCPKNCKKTRQVSVSTLFGEAIRRVTNEESVSSLFV